ncbi:MAG: RadC family protein [Mycoplasmatales bacterium]
MSLNFLRIKNVLELSTYLTYKYNGLENLLALPVSKLRDEQGIGKAKACMLIVIKEIILRSSSFEDKYKQEISNPMDIYESTKEYQEESQEHFIIMSLNTKNQVINKEVIFKGTLNSVNIHPREIFKQAIDVRANKIALIHNHPSGDLTPSEEDLLVTEKIIKGGHLIGIEVIDHIIISINGYLSIRKEHPEYFL